VKPIQVHPEAQHEAEAAIEWYGQRSPHSAGRLVTELRSALERIQQAPKQFPKPPFDTRRMVLGRFPYSIIFRETKTEIEIVRSRIAAGVPAFGANGSLLSVTNCHPVH